MNIITSALFILVAITTYSQQYEIVNASLSENVKVVYRGYGNKMEFKAPVKEGVRYSLTVTNASITLNEGHYILRPGRGKMVGVNLMEINGDRHIVAYRDSFQVNNVPDPSIYINNEISCNSLSGEIKFIQVKFKPQIPLDWKFKVQSWQMLINGELYFGQNNRIPDMVNDGINELKSGDQFTLKVKALGEDEILREYEAIITKK